LSAKAATPTIPIVFNIGDDPVRVGLVTSFARPGGNLTGVSFLGIELTAKRLELLRELVPRTARVAVLVNPADAHVVQATLRDTEAAGRAMGLQIQGFNADTGREMETAFENMARDHADVLFVAPRPFFVARRIQVVHPRGTPRGTDRRCR